MARSSITAACRSSAKSPTSAWSSPPTCLSDGSRSCIARESRSNVPEVTATVPLVALSEVSKAFGSVRAVKAVKLDLFAGEVHALVGENGAAKSTIVKMLAGVHRPDSGTIEIAGEEVRLLAPMQARERGIAVMHQQPALFPDLDIAENVYMGRQPHDRFGRIDWRTVYRDVESRFRQLGVPLDPRRPVRGLSMAEQQLVEIAKALS